MKEGWKRVTLGEIAKFISGYTPKKTELASIGKYPYFKVGDMNSPSNSHFMLLSDSYVDYPKKIYPKGAIVFPKNGGAIYTEKKRILANDSVIDLNTEAVVPNNDVVLTSFFYNLLGYIKISSFDNGGGLPSINIKKMESYSFELPPLPEQQRIVEYFDSTFAEIDALKAKAAEEVTNAKAMFDAALREEMTPKEGWEEKKLGELCDVRDGTHDSPKYVEKGYPLVTSKNLKGSHIDMWNVKYISEKDYNQINDRSKVDIGDILFAMIGTIGNATLVVDEPNYAIKNMALFKTKSIEQGRFLKYLLDSSIVLDEMHEKSKGTTQQFVSLGYLRSFIVHIPNVDQQCTIITRLDSLRTLLTELEQKYAKIAAECDALKQAILRETFE